MIRNFSRPDHYYERPPEIEMIREMARGPISQELQEELDDYVDPQAAFIVKPAERWLRNSSTEAECRMLFDKFWYEGELCILFADTNVGKSILAVQIGNSIVNGEPIGNFEFKADPATVLYFDFELTSKQFEARYSSDVHGNYQFGRKFLRAVLNPESTGERRFKSYEEYINNALENTLITTKANVLIVDNITRLRNGNGTQASSAALNLMKYLQAIKVNYKLSILVLAHTPKRNASKPITRNDLQGSKMLMNFCDSAFAIGESQNETGVRYMKQVKQRNTEETYGAEKVCVARIIKPYNFLQFDFMGFGNERDHLVSSAEVARKKTEAQIAEHYSQGLSLRKIAAQLNISCTTVHRALKNSGQVAV